MMQIDREVKHKAIIDSGVIVPSKNALTIKMPKAEPIISNEINKEVAMLGKLLAACTIDPVALPKIMPRPI